MTVDQIFEYVDSRKDAFVEMLKSWVSVKSVSALPSCRNDCFKMVDLVSSQLRNLGATVSVTDNPLGKQQLHTGESIDLPPIILAQYGNDPQKKTVCVYGHIDVQPANQSDGWDSDPFVLHINGDVMVGRGSSDDKGPVLAWLCLLEAYRNGNLECPVNLKFVLECMEESGSEGLDSMVEQEKYGFLKDVDFVVISDNYWLGKDKPCVTYGLRGIAYFFLEVSGLPRDLHSGVFGGTTYEPMTDLIHIMSRLVDSKGRIIVPGVNDEVAVLTAQEKSSYETIDFDMDFFLQSVGGGISHLTHTDKCDLLMHRWRYPTLSLHGIEGAFSEAGAKTVIPCKVVGKFSIRLVPNMTVEHVVTCVKHYIETLARDLKSPNEVKVVLSHGAPAWVSDVSGPNYVAACRATKRVYGVDPDLTREGGSIPIALTFQEIIGKDVVLLPMGRGDDGAHSQNEKLNISNFLGGIKLFATYLEEISKL